VNEFDVRPEVVELGKQLSNWGRWGPDDQRGTINFITPARVAVAGSLIRRGAVFSLAIPLGWDGPELGDNRINPMRLMTQTGRDQAMVGGFHYADDYVFMPLQSGTQWDSLAHVYYRDQLWNGYSADQITMAGAQRNSIDNVADGVVGRGVLLDIARLRGVDSLEAGEPITPSDLEAAERAQGVEVGSGDIVLIRSGWYGRYKRDRDRTAFRSAQPGLDLSCAAWLHGREVATAAADNWGVEAYLGRSAGRALELHMVLIRDVGMILGEFFDLDELAADCAADDQWAFFFSGPPLNFTGAIGSPINPIVVK
jgi:kynurenine formamidase